MRPAGNRRSRAAVSSLGGGIIRGGMNQKARLVVNVKGSGQAHAHELLLRLYAVATDEETAVFDSLALRAGVKWHCGCGWHNSERDLHCEDCGQPRPLQ